MSGWEFTKPLKHQETGDFILHEKQPQYCLDEFTRLYPPGENNRYCVMFMCCCDTDRFYIRGILEGSKQVIGEEEREILERYQGRYKIYFLTKERGRHDSHGRLLNTDAEILGGTLRIFGGVCPYTEREWGTKTIALTFFRCPERRELYCNAYGAIIFENDKGLVYDDHFGAQMQLIPQGGGGMQMKEGYESGGYGFCVRCGQEKRDGPFCPKCGQR
uniref:Uncharacterized protein n=1 Tax=Paramoeba aestuarina TaxID=180227 RepID=A0A7S4KIA5_9EUKA|mmetsp:Transcript_19767/g.30929  ORF Transcript_19767/g.30929 Transcript_19767/m.30929 type:complete len:217 (+) Transcript_19767:127-777(+)|eukprot:CAMPEP_0201511650 /NCGR_PEP_ID=MMETSP0161_2-20130828/4073_1 /ASSEMBLY_ACC=CAM_ASM_000251 /TAXON_ID=180227 /ORGANISM="Neoparamoeba aestuarina, Strain SoJaBio B1-5/56/2" /LENGTH=216 /DNA_ID=CAMNT_0047907227 /DNA_START=67 /DNA_END=717 /DNA_ORIENTATION=+